VPAQSELTFPLVPRRRLIGLAFGAVNSARRGRGSDVVSSRPYHPGDDVGSIDWNASARLSSARNSDEFIVRERFAEEAPRVVIVCDRRPDMALYDRELPWLSKPAVMAEAGRQIADSTAKAQGLVGYLDYAGGEEPFWRPPHSQQDFWRVKESHLLWPAYGAPRDNLTHAVHRGARCRRAASSSCSRTFSRRRGPTSGRSWPSCRGWSSPSSSRTRPGSRASRQFRRSCSRSPIQPPAGCG
jgi:hypothetical protein